MCGISLVNLQKSHKRPFFRSICEPVPSRLQDTSRQEAETLHHYLENLGQIYLNFFDLGRDMPWWARSDLAHLQLWDKCFSWFAVLFLFIWPG
jgi:hypothetical protein